MKILPFFVLGEAVNIKEEEERQGLTNLSSQKS